MKIKNLLFVLLCFVSIQALAKPKLVVLIVIDQFRADYLTRFEDKFVKGGFKYLMGQGAYYPYAEYDLLQAMTGPGHATILTGAYPYQMGIPLNVWFDQKTNSKMYCVQDKTTETIGTSDPQGELRMSPKNLVGTTVGDELKNAGHASKVISLALKDRAAILMGGHRADLSFWYDEDSHQWISSRYYLKDGKLPAWMQNMNSSTVKRKCNVASPCGVDLTLDAFNSALDQYKLGQGSDTDLISVSFSSHDYVGHRHGPNSKEIEEILFTEDRAIEKLIQNVTKKVPGGAKNIIFALTGDHGISPTVEYLQKAGIHSGRLDTAAIVKNYEEKLDKKFGKLKGKWILFVLDFNFFLNEKAIEEAGLNMTNVTAFLKKELLKEEGIAHAFTYDDYLERKLPPVMFERQILKTYYPGRSGHVVGILKPFFMDGGKNVVNHVTSYTYDKTVPLVIAGPGIKKGIYAEKAEVVDLAPTLSFLLKVLPPALSEGRVLKEALSK